MKKIEYIVLLLMLVVLSGCSDNEVIELKDSNISNMETNINTESSEKEEAKSAESVTGNNTNDTAENSDYSRPFVVFVTGCVNKPGVYELQENSRVIDAIDAAGGYNENACISYINLAEFLHDEDMIYVPSTDEVNEKNQNDEANNKKYGVISGNESRVNSSDVGEKSEGGVVYININTASKEQLMTLPGIGESKASKIIAYREENGPFSSIEGIMQITGIKDGMFNKIKDKICV